MKKFETPPDSPPIIVIDPDDQPMWSSTRTVAPTPSSAIIQRPISTNFRIKGTHMQMIRDNQFDGRIRSDPHRHVADFLEISNLFQYGENQEEAVMLRTFPFSLSRESKTWITSIIQNLERQFEFLLPTKTLPPATNTKTRHEIVYNIPSIRNDNDKGDVKFIEEEETKPNLTMPNPNLITSNSPTVSPFLKDYTVHIPYTQEKVFKYDEISDHVGDKELISFVGIRNEVSKGNIEDTKNPKRPNVSPTLQVMVKEDAWRQANFFYLIEGEQNLSVEEFDNAQIDRVAGDLVAWQEALPPGRGPCRSALGAHKDESGKGIAEEEPEEQHVSLVRSGRGKGYMCIGNREVNVSSKPKKAVVPRKLRTITEADNLIEQEAVELAKSVSIEEQRLQ
ncbi:hypothetical protein Tco_0664132 [Tanacetum coccineum]